MATPKSLKATVLYKKTSRLKNGTYKIALNNPLMEDQDRPDSRARISEF